MKRITLLSVLFFCTLTLSEAMESDNASISSAVEANNAFGLDLYRQLAVKNDGENLFFSSYSMVNALTMSAEGAREHTAEEMKIAMHLPEDLDIAHNGLSMLNTRYSSQQDTPENKELKTEIEKLKEEKKVIAQKIQDYEVNRRMDRGTRREERKIVEELNTLLNKIDPTQITVANALWGEQTFPFKQSYIDRISGFYGTGALHPADFKGDFDTERVRINTWVEEITHERIKDLLPAKSLNKLTRLVISNAIYFKGEWVQPFKEEKTEKKDFTLANGQKVKVSLMKDLMKSSRYAAFNADGSFFNTPKMVNSNDRTSRYPGKDGFSIIELPYRGGKLAMVILAPNSPDGLGAVEKQLDAKNLDRWIGLLKKRKVHARVPKFRSETKYNMNEPLEAMGMVSAFKMPGLSGGANFMGMTDTKNPYEQLYITLVLHKAFVAVDEKGTEAAAATAIVKTLGSLDGYQRKVPFIPEFWADRPFLFLIRDVKTGCILFTGRMMNP